MVLGYLTATLISLRKPQAISIVVASGVQNSTLTITIAVVMLQNSSFGIVGAIYTLVMYIASFAIILFGRK